MCRLRLLDFCVFLEDILKDILDFGSLVLLVDEFYGFLNVHFGLIPFDGKLCPK